MAEHEHHESDDLEDDAEGFWIQIESSALPELAAKGSGALWDRTLHTYQ